MKKFTLNPNEVIVGGSGASGGRKKARFSRANQLSSREMILIHKPTGVQVTGLIPTGHYSRKEMKRLYQELYNDLFAALEQEVAKVLHVPGR